MWKIGPECAAQQAKCASASAANCGVRSASPALMRGSQLAATGVATPGAGGLVEHDGGRRTSSAAGMSRIHGDDAERSASPVRQS